MPRQEITQIGILSGWKEIANYLGKGVRTIQRYECGLGLPIRRPAGRSMGPVIATKAEIDAWITARPIREGFRLSLHRADNAAIKGLNQGVTELHRLREESAELRHEIRGAREALKASIQVLHESLALTAGDLQLSSRRRMVDVLTFDPKRKVS